MTGPGRGRAGWAAAFDAVRDNPVLLKEARTRMRGARGVWILGGYLAVLGGTLTLYYTSWLASSAPYVAGLGSGAVGRELFGMVTGTQAFLVVLIAPAIAAGAITLEREQRTLDMLEVTPLRRPAIVLGKLLTAFAFVALLVVSSLPLASVCFLLGGVSPGQVTHAYAMLLCAGLVQSAIGVAWSSVARNTSAALSYAGATLGMLVAAFGIALASAGAAAPAGAGRTADLAARMVGFSLDLDRTGPSGGRAGALFGQAIPLWAVPVALSAALAALLVAVAAAHLDRYPERRAPASRWLGLLLLALITLAACGDYLGRGLVAAGPAALRLAEPEPPLAVAALALFALAPAIATGVVTQAQARRLTHWLARGWTWSGARRSDLASALPYLLCCAAVVLGIYGLSLLAVGKAGALLPPAVVLAAALFSTWSVGLALSLMMHSRYLAAGVLYVLYVLCMLAAMAATAALEAGSDGASARALVNLHYLNPLTCILHNPAAARAGAASWLLFGSAPFWVVGAAAHAVIGVVALMLATPFVARAAVRPPGTDVRRRSSDARVVP